MSISNESLPIIAGIITNMARSMTTVMRYIYTVSDSDFTTLISRTFSELPLWTLQKRQGLKTSESG